MASGVVSPEGKLAAGFWAALRHPYRVGQGVFTRRIAYWSLVMFSAWASFDLWQWMQGIEVLRRPFSQAFPRLPGLGVELGWSVPLVAVVFAALWVLSAWFLNKPWVSDLLIETEAEMKRVSWPSPTEAWGATKVVAVTVLAITVVLMVFDMVISALLKLIFNLRI